MTVFVYSTGPIEKVAGSTTSASVNINNRTADTQTAVRVAFWDLSSGVKTVISPPGGNQYYTILPNTDLTTALTIPSATTKFEIEIRLPNPHFSPYVQMTGGIVSPTSYKAGTMFFDSTDNENP